MSAARIQVVTSDGVRLDCDTALVIGRKPERDGFAALAVNDPQHSVSRNHVTVVPVSSSLVRVTDLGSTNGSAVRLGHNDVQLRPHEPTHVTLPCRLSVGDHWVDLGAD